jgi:hypothetical protein
VQDVKNFLIQLQNLFLKSETGECGYDDFGVDVNNKSTSGSSSSSSPIISNSDTEPTRRSTDSTTSNLDLLELYNDSSQTSSHSTDHDFNKKLNKLDFVSNSISALLNNNNNNIHNYNEIQNLLNEQKQLINDLKSNQINTHSRQLNKISIGSNPSSLSSSLTNSPVLSTQSSEVASIKKVFNNQKSSNNLTSPKMNQNKPIFKNEVDVDIKKIISRLFPSSSTTATTTTTTTTTKKTNHQQMNGKVSTPTSDTN